ncbi:HPP family protein [Oscillospiraceae bacterium OttesenSCG-928-F05]|nr:HPP family protein [Oscillospiraceae bacterium OttesenSCG-928-F05]
MKKYFERAELVKNIRRSLLIALFVFLVVLVTSFIDSALLITSIGASAFIVFTFPAAESAKARYLLGGYISASVIGVLCSALRQAVIPAGSERIGLVLFCVAAVLLSSLVMSVFDLEHPPSVALAISIVVSDRPVFLAVTAVISMAALFLSKLLLLKVEARLRKAPPPKGTDDPPSN